MWDIVFIFHKLLFLLELKTTYFCLVSSAFITNSSLQSPQVPKSPLGTSNIRGHLCKASVLLPLSWGLGCPGPSLLTWIPRLPLSVYSFFCFPRRVCGRLFLRLCRSEVSSVCPNFSLNLDGHTTEAGNCFPPEKGQALFHQGLPSRVPVEKSDAKLTLEPLNTIWFFLMGGREGVGLGRKNNRESCLSGSWISPGLKPVLPPACQLHEAVSSSLYYMELIFLFAPKMPCLIENL